MTGGCTDQDRAGYGAITWGTVPKVNPRLLSFLVMQGSAFASWD